MNANSVSTGRVGRLAPKACALLVVAALFGCKDLEPCPGVEQGMGFELEVLGPSEPDDACLEAWGFAPGTVVEGRVAELSGQDDCRSGVPDIEAVGAWSYTRVEREIGGGHTFEGMYEVRQARCTARVWLLFAADEFGCDASRGDLCRLEARINVPLESQALCPPMCSGVLDIRGKRL
ncbi:MAG TPA: hypothetical protein VFZ53_17625 [Polyangiaceae bacterium]